MFYQESTRIYLKFQCKFNNANGCSFFNNCIYSMLVEISKYLNFYLNRSTADSKMVHFETVSSDKSFE